MKKDRPLLKDFFVPLLIMLGITGIGIALFMFSIGKGGNIAPVVAVGDEMTKPTVGRIVYLIASLIAFVVCAVLAEKYASKGRLYAAFYTGFIAGMLLWQGIGEASWHFGYTVGESFDNFFRLESPGALWLVLAFALLTGYLMRKKCLGFGVLSTLCSFLCNWFGHFVSEGTYPLVAASMDASRWYAVSGLSVGIVLSAAAVWLALRRFRTTRGRLLCSMLLYIGISVISFGFIE